MNQLVQIGSPALSALVAAAGPRAQTRILEFFAANIRHKHTRRAYMQATRTWCASAGVASIAGGTLE